MTGKFRCEAKILMFVHKKIFSNYLVNQDYISKVRWTDTPNKILHFLFLCFQTVAILQLKLFQVR